MIFKIFQICGNSALIANLKADSDKFATVGRGVGDDARLLADVHALYDQLFHLNRTKSLKVTINLPTKHLSRRELNMVKAAVLNYN